MYDAGRIEKTQAIRVGQIADDQIRVHGLDGGNGSLPNQGAHGQAALL